MDITQQILQIKQEVTYGVDPTPTASDAVLVENLAMPRDSAKVVSRTPIESSKGTRQKIFAGSMRAVTFDMEVKGSGSAGVAPEVAVPLLSCGMAETIVAVTSATYKPASTAQKSCTIWRYIDGKLQKVTGCRGSWALKMTVHDKLMISFNFVGKQTSYADIAMGTATYDTTVPVPIVNCAFTADSVVHTVNSLAIDSNNEVKLATDMGSVNGFGEVSLGKRNISGSIDPEEVLNATYDFTAKLEANTIFAISTATLGSTAGNIFAVSMPAVSFVNDDDGERENKVTRAMTFEAHPSAGDDDISIVFT